MITNFLTAEGRRVGTEVTRENNLSGSLHRPLQILCGKFFDQKIKLKQLLRSKGFLKQPFR